MSLSRKQEETNYWPSISDMFLVFFVMALAISYSKMSGTAEGEKYILEDVMLETAELVSYANEHLEPESSIESPSIKKSSYNEADKQKLSDILHEVYNCLTISPQWPREEFESGDPRNEQRTQTFERFRKELKERKEDRYRSVVALISLHLGLNATAGHEDKQLRLINQKLTSAQDGGSSSVLPAAAAGNTVSSDALAEELQRIREALKGSGHDLSLLVQLIERYKELLQQIRHIESQIQEALEDSGKAPVNIDTLVNHYKELRHQVAEMSKELEAHRKGDDGMVRISEEAYEQLLAEKERLEGRIKELEQEIAGFNARVEEEVQRRLAEQGAMISNVVLKESDVNFDGGRWEPHIKHQKHYKALITKLSAPILALLTPDAKKPGAQIIEIIGHTDKHGWEKLSQDAKAVEHTSQYFEQWVYDYNYNLNASLGLRRANAFIDTIVKSLETDGALFEAYIKHHHPQEKSVNMRLAALRVTYGKNYRSFLAHLVETPNDIKNARSKPNAILKFRAYSASFNQPRSTDAESRRLEVITRPETFTAPTATKQ